MHILITGANGFLGYYLTEQLVSKNYTVIATGKGPCRLPFASGNFSYRQMDFTHPLSVEAVFTDCRPGVIVHAGAISKPDDCEQEPQKAYVTNVVGTAALLRNTAALKCHFIFISTDFVFNGQKGNYREDDDPDPVNYYGKTKLEAEEAVRKYAHAWSIVRTALVYGKTHSGRTNILTLVKEKLQRGEAYSVFDDQVRTPTCVEDLARGIVSIIKKKATGVYHIAGKDILTPYQMAVKAATYLHLDTSLLKKVTAANLSQPARRPPVTNLIVEKAARELGFEPMQFEEGLRKTFD